MKYLFFILLFISVNSYSTEILVSEDEAGNVTFTDENGNELSAVPVIVNSGKIEAPRVDYQPDEFQLNNLEKFTFKGFWSHLYPVPFVSNDRPTFLSGAARIGFLLGDFKRIVGLKNSSEGRGLMAEADYYVHSLQLGVGYIEKTKDGSWRVYKLQYATRNTMGFLGIGTERKSEFQTGQHFLGVGFEFNIKNWGPHSSLYLNILTPQRSGFGSKTLFQVGFTKTYLP